MEEYTDIEKALAQLIGLPIRAFGRAADLLWIHFGELEQDYSTQENKLDLVKTVGDCAIHIQCPWRLIHNNSVVLSWRDIHNFNPGDVNRFDVESDKLNKYFAVDKTSVLSVIVGNAGAFTLKMDNEYIFEVFPDESLNDGHSEEWRIFQPKSINPQFIF